MRLVTTTALAASFFLTVASSAQALPIVFAGAPTGLTFSIESVSLDPTDMFVGDSTDDTYLVTLKLVTNGYVDVGSANYLTSIALDAADDTLDAGEILNGPGGLVWTEALDKPVAANGTCGSPDADGALCGDDTNIAAPNVALAGLNTYEFVFRLDIPSTGFVAPTLYVGISEIQTTSGRFKQITGSPFVLDEFTGEFNPQVGGTSAPVAAPEPASLLLVGTGVVFAARRMRRRKVSA